MLSRCEVILEARPQKSGVLATSGPSGAADRMPPCNLDAERAILGAVLLEREAVGLVREKLQGQEFYRKEHRLIFDAMCRLYESDQAIDAITVSELLERDGNLSEVGGIDYLAHLAASVATDGAAAEPASKRAKWTRLRGT